MKRLKSISPNRPLNMIIDVVDEDVENYINSGEFIYVEEKLKEVKKIKEIEESELNEELKENSIKGKGGKK